MQKEGFEELIKKIADGDQAAFTALYVEFEQQLFRFISLKLNDRAESSDILHEVFLEVWQNSGRFDGRSSVKTWLFSIAYRKTIDVFRKRAWLTVTDKLEDTMDDTPSAEQRLLSAQQSAHLHHCLGSLTPEHRSAVELAFFEGMSYREIAAVAGVPENTAKTRVFHAKKLLMHCLKSRIEPGEV